VLVSNVTTRVHSTLRVVVRGFPLGEGGKCNVGGVDLLVLTRAKAADWPDVELAKGDLETVAWTTPAEANRLADTLLADPRVVSVRVEAEPLEVG